MQRHEDRVHLLVVTPDGDGVHHEIVHWPDCPQVEWDQPPGEIPWTPWYGCLTGTMWGGAGLDLLDGQQLEPGTYALMAWATPGGWAGANPIDPDGGFDVLGPLPPAVDARLWWWARARALARVRDEYHAESHAMRLRRPDDWEDALLREAYVFLVRGSGVTGRDA